MKGWIDENRLCFDQYSHLLLPTRHRKVSRNSDLASEAVFLHIRAKVLHQVSHSALNHFNSTLFA